MTWHLWFSTRYSHPKIWATVQSYPHKPFWNFSGHTNSSPFGGSSFSKLFCSLSVATSHTWGWPSWGEEDRWGSDNWTVQKVGNRLELKIATLESECSVLRKNYNTCTILYPISPIFTSSFFRILGSHMISVAYDGKWDFDFTDQGGKPPCAFCSSWRPLILCETLPASCCFCEWNPWESPVTQMFS